MRFVTVTDPPDPTPPTTPPEHPVPAAPHRTGLLLGDRVRLFPEGTTLLDLLHDPDGLTAAGEKLNATPGETVALTGVHLAAPLPQPPTVRDFMVFERHVEGVSMLMGDGSGPVDEWYEMPAFYFTNPYAVTGPYDDVPVPPGCQVLDFELEVAAVVGKAGRDLTIEEAEGHIAGYMIMNDWSARDLQGPEMRVRLGPAKAKDTATTLGPALVTADELAPYREGDSFDLGMSVSVNGTVIGSDRLTGMAWSFAEMVAYASRGTWVRPGDVLGSGTCGGGCLAELWGRRGRDALPSIQVGDVVTMTVEQLGTLRNTVVPGVAPHPLAPRTRPPHRVARPH
ncbi:fumarylacetoacetate hydrolase family protein [Streptomyces sp. NPDC091292]|uniref:fumarylacetoacetate hydrolase family protein n=1 Tax=Streptomyces sp. NPDC091292 TaxID=3365991 RepID=UPI00380B544A